MLEPNPLLFVISLVAERNPEGFIFESVGVSFFATFKRAIINLPHLNILSIFFLQYLTILKFNINVSKNI